MTHSDMGGQVAVDKHYDLIILGTGSGNSLPSPEFDDLSIAIIEEGRFGGTCLNVGCIPTKMYVAAADAAFAAREAQHLGVDMEFSGVRLDTLQDRVFAQRIDRIAEGGEAYRRGPQTPNIDVYDQHAYFVAPRTLHTGIGDTPMTISADQVVVAAGSRTVVPEVIANSGVRYRTNADIMRLPQVPKSLLIVGGGYIAMEFAHVFDALGTQVTLAVRSSQVLRHLDDDLRARINDIARKRFEVRTAEVTALAETPEGQIAATLTTAAGESSTLLVDEVLVATGRISNADQLHLEAAGIAMKGSLLDVDVYGRSTTAPGVWALGDVSSPYQLKHVANAEARTVWHNLRHPEDLQRLPHDHVPAAIFTHPQIATVGLTEHQAREQGFNVTVKVQNYGDVAYGWALEDHSGIAKLIADRDTGQLLGAHYLGPQAATLIQQMITVLAYGIDLRDFARRQYWIHPALPEVTENAILGLEFS